MVVNLQGVLAGFGSLVAESRAQEIDVGGLVLTDHDEASTGPRREASGDECSLIELGKCAAVKGVLEMLKSESEIENGGIYAYIETSTLDRIKSRPTINSLSFCRQSRDIVQRQGCYEERKSLENREHCR